MTGQDRAGGSERALSVAVAVVAVALLIAGVLATLATGRPAGIVPAREGRRSVVAGVDGVRWHQIPAASDPTRSVWWGEVEVGIGNDGPTVLIVPGGGGQVTAAVAQQGQAYAAAGLRVLIGCIATVERSRLPGPPTSCPGTRAATPGSKAAAEDVARLVVAVGREFPEVVEDPARLVVIGDSYGGAAVLQAAALTGWSHPVISLNGTATWQGDAPPLVPAGDLDPADPGLLERLAGPVVLVTGTEDELVPVAVAHEYSARAAEAGVEIPVVEVVGVNHAGAFEAEAGSCVHRTVSDIVGRLSGGRPVAEAEACG